MAKEDSAAVETPPAPEPEPESKRQRRRQPFEIKGLPDGLRAVLNLKPWRDAAEFWAYIYAVYPDPQKPGKEKRKFALKIYNTDIDEAWLQDRFPRGGKFRIMYNVQADGGDVEIHTDDFDIEAMEGAAPMVAPGAPPTPGSAQVDPGAYPSRRNQLQDLRDLAEIMVLLRGDAPPAPVGNLAVFEKMYADRLRRLDELEEKMMKRTGLIGMNNGAAKTEAEGWPEFIKPFAPLIKEWGGKLLGTGIEASLLRSAVLSNPAFREVWRDAEKRAAAAQAIISHLGEAGQNLVTLFEHEMEKNGGG